MVTGGTCSIQHGKLYNTNITHFIQFLNILHIQQSLSYA